MLQPTKGIVPEIVQNTTSLYEGTLRFYFCYIFKNATNLSNPYHNYRHLMHVLVAAYEACKYHEQELSQRQIRVILIAAMFHDVNHKGIQGNDHENIKRSIKVLESCILPEDIPYFDDISRIIRSTEFPHKIANEDISLDEKIMRDADMVQAFSPFWFQDIIYGLGKEWQISAEDMLDIETDFLARFKPCSGWGQATYNQSVIQEKAREVQDYIALLEE